MEVRTNDIGRKDDTGKHDYSLLSMEALDQVVKVLEFGADKYARGGWRHVDSAERRYYSACIRHLKRYQAGEDLDDESGLPHLAHATACLLFLLGKDTTNKFDK